VTSTAVRAVDLFVTYRPPMGRLPFNRRRAERLTVPALRGIDFEARQGDSMAVIGRNGSGKSSLLRVIAGTLPPDSGSIDVSGRVSALLALGSAFNTDLAARRNVMLGCLAGGLSRGRAEEMMDEIISFAALGAAVDRPLRTYSSGMLSRLAFAVGMATQPDILLIDEVLSVGDEAFQEQSRIALTDLVSRSGTLIFVSHNLRAVRELCETALWLEAGQVAEFGDARAVVKRYRAASRSGH
jgi:ABC-type polysaccharide/polyol phosphate transport system ATPase subunit